MSTSTERMARKRHKQKVDAVIVAGARQASLEKHESVTLAKQRTERALAYADWRDSAYDLGECSSPARQEAYRKAIDKITKEYADKAAALDIEQN